MKAFLLAAGYGTRLRPLTNTAPKCLVPICGKPLLAWWLQLFERYNIQEVLINTHYLPDAVREFINKHNKSTSKVRIEEFYEPLLLGSGGTILANKNFVGSEKEFLICYADNLTNVNLESMISFHRQKNSILTMGLFHTNKPKECGIAAIDSNKLIYEFVEKPQNPKSNLANAGIYVTNNEIFNYIPNIHPCDFGKDVLPKLVNKMYGYEIKEYLLDIGNLDNYQKAQEEWQR